MAPWKLADFLTLFRIWFANHPACLFPPDQGGEDRGQFISPLIYFPRPNKLANVQSWLPSPPRSPVTHFRYEGAERVTEIGHRSSTHRPVNSRTVIPYSASTWRFFQT